MNIPEIIGVLRAEIGARQNAIEALERCLTTEVAPVPAVEPVREPARETKSAPKAKAPPKGPARLNLRSAQRKVNGKKPLSGMIREVVAGWREEWTVAKVRQALLTRYPEDKTRIMNGVSVNLAQMEKWGEVKWVRGSGRESFYRTLAKGAANEVKAVKVPGLDEDYEPVDVKLEAAERELEAARAKGQATLVSILEDKVTMLKSKLSKL